MASSSTESNGPIHLGFLTVRKEGTSYIGGYLVTNVFGRPLEFRISSAVQPNKVHEILYGATLEPYICGELIGKTLVEKATVAADYLITDQHLTLDLRRVRSTPLVWLRSLASSTDGSDVGSSTARAVELSSTGAELETDGAGHDRYFCHPEHLSDLPVFRSFLEEVGRHIDLTEPFSRIRDAVREARKAGSVGRAA